jgi:hypothetical protein
MTKKIETMSDGELLDEFLSTHGDLNPIRHQSIRTELLARRTELLARLNKHFESDEYVRDEERACPSCGDMMSWSPNGDLVCGNPDCSKHDAVGL